MRKLFYILGCIAVVFACSKGDEKVTEQKKSIGDPPENIMSHIRIKGGKSVVGTMPLATGTLNLDLSSQATNAYLVFGFDIPIISNDSIIGVYIQFMKKGSQAPETYFDIDLQENNALPFKQSGKVLQEPFKQKFVENTSKPGFDKLDVDFGNFMEPSEICYVISAYDTAGNVSSPQEICLIVNDWGNSVDLVGTWNMVRQIRTYDNGNTLNILSENIVGQQSCETHTPTCDSGESFDYTACFTIVYSTYTFGADGTYTWEQSFIDDQQLDIQSSYANCSPIYFGGVQKGYVTKGKWALNSEDKQLLSYREHEKFITNGVVDEERINDWESIRLNLGYQPEVEVNGTSLTWGTPQGYVDRSGNIRPLGNQEFFEKQ